SHQNSGWSRWPEDQPSSQHQQSPPPHHAQQSQQQPQQPQPQQQPEHAHSDFVLQQGPHHIAHSQAPLPSLPHPHQLAHNGQPSHPHAHPHANQPSPSHMYQHMVGPTPAYAPSPTSVVPMHPHGRLATPPYTYSYMHGQPAPTYHAATTSYAAEMHLPMHAAPQHIKDDRGHMRMGMDSPTSVGAPSPSSVLPHSPMSASGINYAMPQHQMTMHQMQSGPAPIQTPMKTASPRTRRRSPRGHSMADAIPNANSKTVQPNVCLNPEHEAAFNTVVDGLVKVIQEEDTESLLPKAKSQPPVQHIHQPHQPHQMTASPVIAMPSPAQSPNRVTKKTNKSRTRHYCSVPGCDRSFGQKSHLDIHHRAHTGEKPYTCSIPGCDRRFSQLGNLRTHERLHSGERPHVCDQCGKAFSARGKLKGHQAIHNGERHFVCKLEDCNKGFTQLGNLKAHQNKFHEGAIKQLTNKFVNMTAAERANMTSYDLEVLEYFATLYKNSNKGIKGRGKGRKVHIVRPTGAAAAAAAAGVNAAVNSATVGVAMQPISLVAPQMHMGMAQHTGHMAAPPQMMHPGTQSMRSYEMRPMMQSRIDSYSTTSSAYDGPETRSLPDQSVYEDERLRRPHY
ncbi:hypothetical protein TD95_002131, partial [Thielaviopsis punctulata]